MQRSAAALAFALCLAILSSCGGGGGGGGGSIPSEPVVYDPTVAIDPATVLAQSQIDAWSKKKAEIELEGDYSGASAQLGRIKAAHAYARGATGLGETVLVVDSGLNEEHFEFSEAGGKVGEVSKEPLVPGYDHDIDAGDHGTAVAGAAAGGRAESASGSERMQGVAYEASVHMAYDCFGARPDCSSGDDLYGIALDIARAQGAYVVNFSFGFGTIVSEHMLDSIRMENGDLARELEQQGVHPADKVVIVWAGGHDSHDEVSLPAGLGVAFEELQKHVLAVVAVESEAGEIVSFSNYCGIAKAFCLAAPGGQVVLPKVTSSCPTDCYSTNVVGTSISTPMVSGAVALLRQYFRNMLGSTDIAQRLLATADKSEYTRVVSGTTITINYGDSDIYGQGLLDLDKATWPVGVLAVMSESRVGGASLPFAGTRLGMAGAAAGDRAAKAFAGRELAVLDELDAPFFVSLDSLAADVDDELSGEAKLLLDAPWNSAEARVDLRDSSIRLGVAPGIGGPRISRLSRHSINGGSERFLSLRGHPGNFYGPYRSGAAASGGRLLHSPPFLDFVADGFGAGGSTLLSDAVRLSYGAFRGRAIAPGGHSPTGKHNAGFMAEVALADDALILQGGRLRESAGVAGLLPQGAMGAFEGDTTFGGIVVQSELGSDWTARAAAHAGRSLPRKRLNGMVERIDPLLSSAYSISLEGGNVLARDDLLGLSLSQPMRIEKGSMYMRIPVARTRYGDIVHESFEAGLEPDARHLDLRASYSRSSRRTDLQLHAGVERHADHVAANGVNPYLQLHWRTTF